MGTAARRPQRRLSRTLLLSAVFGRLGGWCAARADRTCAERRDARHCRPVVVQSRRRCVCLPATPRMAPSADSGRGASARAESVQDHPSLARLESGRVVARCGHAGCDGCRAGRLRGWASTRGATESGHSSGRGVLHADSRGRAALRDRTDGDEYVLLERVCLRGIGGRSTGRGTLLREEGKSGRIRRASPVATFTPRRPARRRQVIEDRFGE